MSKQYPGGFIIKNPTTPTTSSAPGMWTLNQAAYYTKQGIWPAPPVIDPYFEYVTTLLHGDGTNAAQNNTFIDSSTNAYSITRNGTPTQGTFTPFGSNWSNYFDGTTDYLTAPANAAFGFGTGDFTAECWVYPVSWVGLYDGFISTLNSGTAVGIHLSRDGVEVNGVATAWGTTLSLNTWTHLALTRSGTSLRLFVNGAITNSGTNSANIGSSSAFAVGRRLEDVSNYYCNAYISNARIVKGTAVYTSAFTPSTTPLTAISGTSVLTCQSNRFIDNSTNNFTITKNGDVSVQRFSPFNPASAYSTSVIGGSMYFNGSTDYLTVPLAAYDFGTGAFTCEAWVYIRSVASSNIIFYGSVSGGALDELAVSVNTSQQLGWETNNTISNSGGSVPLNTWTHIALVRNGSTITGYVNGISVGTTTDSGAITPTTHSLVGSYRGTVLFTNGYISNARVTKAAVYTSNFTPATAPLPAIANTSLLLLGTNAGIYDNSMMPDWVTIGNAQISTSVKKYGTGSMSFDGTDDRLTSATNPAFAFGTGDFTVEAWINTNILTGEKGFIQTSATVGGLQTSYTNGVIAVVAAGAGSYTINVNIAGTNVAGSIPVTTGTWYHVAFTRASGVVRSFINGALSGGPTTITANLDGQNMVVGGYYSTGYLWNGYVDDLRVTKGFARYTAAFTPPTSAFPDQ